MPKTVRFWTFLGSYFGSLLASRWLQHGFQSSQDGSKTTQGASKTRLICLQDRPSTSQDTSRTAPSTPKAPARLSKSLQEGSGSLQGASKSSPEEVFETPNRFQELSRGKPSKPPALGLQPLASGLQVGLDFWPPKRARRPQLSASGHCFHQSSGHRIL